MRSRFLFRRKVELAWRSLRGFSCENIWNNVFCIQSKLEVLIAVACLRRRRIIWFRGLLRRTDQASGRRDE
jgi:hypothetical protein